MKKIFAFVLLSLCSTGLFASGNAGCQYVDGSAKVQWTAYKSKKRIPVKGLLKRIKIQPNKGSNMQAIVNGSKFDVSGAKGSVDSKNAVRDGKIAKFFFGNFAGGPVIKGNVTKVTKDTITTSMGFNGISKSIDFKYTFKNGLLTARASLDFVSQFGAKKSFQEIGKACAAKHEGVTGTDAAMELTAKFTGC